MDLDVGQQLNVGGRLNALSNKGWDVGAFGHSLSAGGVRIIFSNIPDPLKASVCARSFGAEWHRALSGV